jgi:hypothetical protein
MKAFKIFGSILGLCVTTPLWYILFYKILVRIDATDGMWVLFWIYMPVGILVSILLKASELAPAK